MTGPFGTANRSCTPFRERGGRRAGRGPNRWALVRSRRNIQLLPPVLGRLEHVQFDPVRGRRSDKFVDLLLTFAFHDVDETRAFAQRATLVHAQKHATQLEPARCHSGLLVDSRDGHTARQLFGQSSGQQATVEETNDLSDQPPDPGVQSVLAGEDRSRKLGDLGAISSAPVANDAIPRLFARVLGDPVRHRVQHVVLGCIGAEHHGLIDEPSLGVLRAGASPRRPRRQP